MLDLTLVTRVECCIGKPMCNVNGRETVELELLALLEVAAFWLYVADSLAEEDVTYGLADEDEAADGLWWTVSVTVCIFPGTDTIDVTVDFGTTTEIVDGLAEIVE